MALAILVHTRNSTAETFQVHAPSVSVLDSRRTFGLVLFDILGKRKSNVDAVVLADLKVTRNKGELVHKQAFTVLKTHLIGASQNGYSTQAGNG